MKLRNIFLFACTIAMILATSTQSALAYFSTYAKAEGGHVIHLGQPGDTYMTENFTGWTDEVTVVNNGQPVYVRARAFVGDLYTLEYVSTSGLWYPGSDGYWHYKNYISAGESTDALSIHLANVPEGATVGNSFHMVVVYETTPVQYDQNGNAYADWFIVLEGGNVG